MSKRQKKKSATPRTKRGKRASKPVANELTPTGGRIKTVPEMIDDQQQRRGREPK